MEEILSPTTHSLTMPSAITATLNTDSYFNVHLLNNPYVLSSLNLQSERKLVQTQATRPAVKITVWISPLFYCSSLVCFNTIVHCSNRQDSQLKFYQLTVLHMHFCDFLSQGKNIRKRPDSKCPKWTHRWSGNSILKNTNGNRTSSSSSNFDVLFNILWLLWQEFLLSEVKKKYTRTERMEGWWPRVGTLSWQ